MTDLKSYSAILRSVCDRLVGRLEPAVLLLLLLPVLCDALSAAAAAVLLENGLLKLHHKMKKTSGKSRAGGQMDTWTGNDRRHKASLCRLVADCSRLNAYE